MSGFLVCRGQRASDALRSWYRHGADNAVALPLTQLLSGRGIIGRAAGSQSKCCRDNPSREVSHSFLTGGARLRHVPPWADDRHFLVTLATAVAPTRLGGFQLSDRTGHSVPENLYIGCAGWSLSRGSQEEFPAEGTHLQRYAAMFRAVEINSSFHRPHRASTYERWAQSVPDTFRFAVKLPKTITHDKRLLESESLVDAFLSEVAGLGRRLGPLLVQLPPSLEFDPATAESFFSGLLKKHGGEVVIEPRHRTWFGQVPNKMLQEFRIGRVAADPAVIPVAGEPGGSPGTVYFRLHGSPQIYYSAYTSSYLDGLAFRLGVHSRAGGKIWVMFDNTIRGSATLNALYLARKIALVESGRPRR